MNLIDVIVKKYNGFLLLKGTMDINTPGFHNLLEKVAIFGGFRTIARGRLFG